MPRALLLSALLQAVAGLRLTSLVGPPYPDRGEDVRLICNFDTGRGRLYSVKWYKDENEFFRFMPDNRPQTQVFPLNGVTLDDAESDKSHVTLRNVGFLSSGSYRCEVSTEAPNFETVFLNHNMTVLSYPQEDPQLWGAQEVYTAGDLVNVNCTAPASYPPPQIHFYINSDQAEEWLMERGVQVLHEDGSVATSAALKFQAERQHFLGPDDVLTLRCEILAPPLPTLSVTRLLYLAASSNQRLAQHTFRKNHGCTVGSASSHVFVVLLLLLLSWS